MPHVHIPTTADLLDGRTSDDTTPWEDWGPPSPAEGERYTLHVHSDADLHALGKFLAQEWPDLRIIFTDNKGESTP